MQLESSEEEVETPAVHHMGKPSATHPITLEMSVDDTTLHMELNTRAAVSIISEKTHKLFGDVPLQISPIALKTYTGEPMAMRGQRIVQVRYGSQERTFPLTVVAGNDLPCWAETGFLKCH